MKRTYEKPVVFAEDFRLYEHISSGACFVNKELKVQAGYIDSDNCLYWDDNIARYIYEGNCRDAMDQWIDPDLGMNPDDPSTWGNACYNAFGDAGLAHAFVS